MKVVIVGAGQNGGQVYNILKLDKEVQIAGFLDDDPDKQGTEKYGLPVFGAVSTVQPVAAKFGVRGAIVAVGNNGIRGRMTNQLREGGLCIVCAIHTHTFIDDTARIGQGSIIEMGAMIHPGILPLLLSPRSSFRLNRLSTISRPDLSSDSACSVLPS